MTSTTRSSWTASTTRSWTDHHRYLCVQVWNPGMAATGLDGTRIQFSYTESTSIVSMYRIDTTSLLHASAAVAAGRAQNVDSCRGEQLPLGASRSPRLPRHVGVPLDERSGGLPADAEANLQVGTGRGVPRDMALFTRGLGRDTTPCQGRRSVGGGRCMICAMPHRMAKGDASRVGLAACRFH